MGKTKILSDFRPVEVSFVKKGANRKKRYLVKEESNMNIDNLLETVQKAEIDFEAIQTEVQKAYEGLDGDGLTALTAAVALIKSAKDKLPEGFSMSYWVDGMSAAVYKAEEVEALKAELTEAKTKLEEEIKKQEVPAEPEPVQISKEAQEQIEKAEQEILILKAEIEKAKDKAMSLEFIAKAEKEFPRIGNAEELGTVLKDIHKSAGEEVASKLESILKDVSAVLNTSADITKEIGTTDVPDNLSVEQKVQKLAEVYKSEHNCTIEQARVAIRKSHPELK